MPEFHAILILIEERIQGLGVSGNGFLVHIHPSPTIFLTSAKWSIVNVSNAWSVIRIVVHCLAVFTTVVAPIAVVSQLTPSALL